MKQTLLLVLLVLVLHCSTTHVAATHVNSTTAAADLSQIKVITFDVFGALMNTFESMKQNVQRLTAGYLSTSDANTLAQSWVSFYGRNFMQYNSVLKMYKPATTPFQLLISVGLNYSIAELNPEAAKKIPATVKKQLLERAWMYLKPWPKTGEALVQLANLKDPQTGAPRNLKFGTLSNGDTATLKNLTSIFFYENKVKFDYWFGCEGAGLFKPEPLFYQQVEKVTGLQKNEILHVAGSGFDAFNAKLYGYRAAWNYGDPAQLENLTGDPKFNPDFYLTDLTQLPKLFGQ